jgi:polyisoprenoid-binding protein YceI
VAIAKIVKWLIISAVAGVVILAGLVLAVIAIAPKALAGPTADPLQLPPANTAATSASAGAPDGTWVVGSGSVAGFRVEESFLSQHGTLVGRTSAVTGSLVVAHGAIIAGSFQADLSQLTLGGKPNPNFLKMMDTQQYPNATLALTAPIAWAHTPATGETAAGNATGALTLRGITQPVTYAFTGRYDGSGLQATGTTPVLASAWGIESPFGLHDNDVIEFLVFLQPK